MKLLILLAVCTLMIFNSSTILAQTVSPSSPTGLVRALYKVHNQKRGPFHTGHSALLYKYFDKHLADMIRKDAATSAAKNEVGVLDGDPLYDAQDFDIKNFAIGNATYENGKAKVPVTFENIGQKKTLIFALVKTHSGWRIGDIDYGDGRTLVGEFKEPK